MKSKNLILDTNIVFSSLLSRNNKYLKLFFNSKYEFILLDYLEEEFNNRYNKILKNSKLSSESINLLYQLIIERFKRYDVYEIQKKI